MTSVVR